MSKFYIKAKRGPKTTLEKIAIDGIEKIIEANSIDKSTITQVTTPDELYALHDSLRDEYGTPPVKKDVFPEPIKESNLDPVKKDIPAEETPDSESEFNLEPTESLTQKTDVSTDYYELSDFEEITPDNAFAGDFKQEDLFKVENNFQSTSDEDGSSPLDSSSDSDSAVSLSDSQEESPTSVTSDATRNAWDIKKQSSSEEKLKSLDSIDTSEKKPASDADIEKVKLAKKTGVIATKSLAKQSAKLFEFVTEWAVKKTTKVSDSFLDKMEESGAIDRSYTLPSGETVAEFVEAHNELIDEIVETDPDMREELIEAIMLVAQKHQIEVSPEANLGMVVLTMMITLAKTGFDAKKQMKKTLRKVSDTYLMQKNTMVQQTQHLADSDKKISELLAVINQLKPDTETKPVEPELVSPENENIRSLNFDSSPTRSFENVPSSSKSTPETVSSNMREITSEFEGDKMSHTQIISTDTSGKNTGPKNTGPKNTGPKKSSS